jgi:hypothetical protein
MHISTEGRCEMKGRLIVFVGIFCIAVLVISGQDAQGKPDKPGESKAEWIAFDGDLVGGQPVVGCCPNAGPWPEYTMTLLFEAGDFPSGTYGELFINYYGAGRNQKYKVQFWNNEIDLFIEIIGGVIDQDRKNKILTVTFTDEECVNGWTGNHIAYVTFTLVRHPI